MDIVGFSFWGFKPHFMFDDMSLDRHATRRNPTHPPLCEKTGTCPPHGGGFSCEASQRGPERHSN